MNDLRSVLWSNRLPSQDEIAEVSAWLREHGCADAADATKDAGSKIAAAWDVCDDLADLWSAADWASSNGGGDIGSAVSKWRAEEAARAVTGRLRGEALVLAIVRALHGDRFLDIARSKARHAAKKAARRVLDAVMKGLAS